MKSANSKLRPSALLVALFLLLSLLAGCNVYEESLTLDKDGGALAEVRINSQAIAQLAPEAADPVRLKMILSHTRPADIDVSVEKKDGDTQIVFETKKVNELIEWSRKENTQLGTAAVQVLDGTMDVTRTFAPINEFDLKELDKVPNLTMVFKITGPGKLVSSDATRTDGHTAIWEVKPHDIFSGNGKSFHARYNISTPWLTYFLILLTVLGAGAFLFVMMRKRD